MLKLVYNNKLNISSYHGYYYIIANPEASGKLNFLLEYHSCREFFIKSYRNIINNNPTKYPLVKEAYALISYGMKNNMRKSDFDKLTIEIQNESRNSLFIINSFEKAHKWPLTKVYPVKCINTRKKIPLVFFKGSRKWTMSPYLMSIWSLCIRLGRNKWLPKNLLTLNHTNLVKQLSINARRHTGNTDAVQVYSTLKKWDGFLSLYQKLFAGVDRKHHWSTTHLNGGNDRREGIKMLITGDTAYKELYNKYKELTK